MNSLEEIQEMSITNSCCNRISEKTGDEGPYNSLSKKLGGELICPPESAFAKNAFTNCITIVNGDSLVVEFLHKYDSIVYVAYNSCLVKMVCVLNQAEHCSLILWEISGTNHILE
jgi:hypothetical protein